MCRYKFIVTLKIFIQFESIEQAYFKYGSAKFIDICDFELRNENIMKINLITVSLSNFLKYYYLYHL